MNTVAPLWLWFVFVAIVLVALFVDFVVLRKQGAHDVGVKEALNWSIVWVLLSLAFNGLLWWAVRDSHGIELANAYTELNDPILQEQLFRTQLSGQKEEDSMAKMDHDFIRALRHGMPPAGGLGVGIDRLVMLLTGAQSIREVILFPLLRHEAR